MQQHCLNYSFAFNAVVFIYSHVHSHLFDHLLIFTSDQLTTPGHRLRLPPRNHRRQLGPRLIRLHRQRNHLILHPRKQPPLPQLPRRNLLRPQRRSHAIPRTHSPPPLAPNPARQALPRTPHLTHPHPRHRHRHRPLGRRHSRLLPRRRNHRHRPQPHPLHLGATQPRL
jgi:hypothetical protein